MDFNTIEGKKDLMLMLLYVDRIRRKKNESVMSPIDFKMIVLANGIDFELFFDSLILSEYIDILDNTSAPYLNDKGSRFLLSGGYSHKIIAKEDIQEIVYNVINIYGDNIGAISQSTINSNTVSTKVNNEIIKTKIANKIIKILLSLIAAAGAIATIYEVCFKNNR